MLRSQSFGEGRIVEPSIAQLVAANNAAHSKIDACMRELAALKAAPKPGAGLNPLVPRFIEDIPGKRVPYSYNINLTITNTTQTPGTFTVSQDGPFLATQLLAAWRPTAGADSGANAGAGRWRKINSIWALASDGAGGTYRDPDTVDFEWRYSCSGSDRARQNEVLRSSVELFSVHDRPYYLPIADFFERSTTVTVEATMLRTPLNAGILKFQFIGYKLLQPIALAG